MSVLPAVIIGYFIGGIPTGILISRAVAGVDPRTLGSHSSGATNVSRAIGRKWAIVVLLLDALKGFLPVYLLSPLLTFGAPVTTAAVAMAFGTVLGHVWTPYARFRGGKGIATSAGALVALDWAAVATALAVWVVFFLAFRRVSLASIMGAIAVPVTMAALGGRPPLVLAAGIGLSVLLVFTHRDNIRRLRTGHERPIA